MRVAILKSVISAALIVGLLLAFAVPADARSVRVIVTDEDKQPIQDVLIRVEGTDVTRVFDRSNQRTNRRGEFTLLLGPILASYRVIARKEGFEPAFRENIRPAMDEQVLVELTLRAGSDFKLPFEMSDADRAEQQRRVEEQQQRAQFSAEVNAHFEQGIALFNAGQFSEALAEFNAALAIDPNQPGIVARTGDCLVRLNRNEEALAAYERAIEIDPGDASLYAQKGVVLSRLGRTAESQEFFKRSAELDPRGAAQNFFNLGATLFNASEMDKAAEAFKQSIAADPNYAESYYMLGISLANDEGMFPAAIDAFKRYVEIGSRADHLQIAKEMIVALGG